MIDRIIYSSTSFIFILALLLPANNCSGRQRNWYFNPGVKLGYAFGKDGGFISGVELSLTTTLDNQRGAWGILFSLEKCRSYTMLHFGGEIFPNSPIGFSFGPSLIRQNDKNEFGASATLFGGALILPYYRYTYRHSLTDINELGAFLKWFVPLQKENFSLGG